MSVEEKLNLIFLPGFSTKEQATEISGRGVGMDVVKQNLEIIGAEVNNSSISAIVEDISKKNSETYKW